METYLGQIVSRAPTPEFAAQTAEECRHLAGLLRDPELESIARTQNGRLLDRAEYSVREWCRQARIRAKNKPCERGKGGERLVSHDNFLRPRNEGLIAYRLMTECRRSGPMVTNAQMSHRGCGIKHGLTELGPRAKPRRLSGTEAQDTQGTLMSG